MTFWLAVSAQTAPAAASANNVVATAAGIFQRALLRICAACRAAITRGSLLVSSGAESVSAVMSGTCFTGSAIGSAIICDSERTWRNEATVFEVAGLGGFELT